MSNESNAQAVISYIERLLATRPEVKAFEADGIEVPFVVSGGELLQLRSLVDDYLPRPRRRKGTATFTDQTSFEQHVNRFKNEASTLWATRSSEGVELRCVLNYHPSGDALPEHGDHVGVYSCPASEEWLAWQEENATWMSQSEFASFLEDRERDIVGSDKAPDDVRAAMERLGRVIAEPLDLVALARGLRVHVRSEVQNETNLQTGECEIQFKTEHSAQRGGQTVVVPGAFVVQIPIFERGEEVQLGVLLRYRVTDGIKWRYDLYRPTKVLEDAFHQACESASKETALPLFFGTPEA